MERMLETEIWSIARIDRGNAVLLRPLGMDLVVPVFVGALEVHAILLGLGNIKAKRPLSCDLFLEMIHHLGISLFRVEIHEIREDIFHARIFLSGREFSPSNPLVMDSRPSDAFALAVREKCPVFMAAKVLDRTGIPADIFVEEGATLTEPWPKEGAFEGGRAEKGRKDAKEEDSPAARRRRLQAELEESIEKEAYERAAEIRDLLILLDQQIEQERRGKGIS
jgi:bifunctional DNase/RNase